LPSRKRSSSHKRAPSRKRDSDRHQDRGPETEQEDGAGARVRSLWSGTITFGLVSIPVDLLSAVRPRQTAMKLVDKAGHALGRQYHCSKEGKKLDNEELVRGYETDDG
jgi:DNA end-binding protein Ku